MERAGTDFLKLEKKRDVWQEAIDAIREIKAGGGRRIHVRATAAAKARQRTGLSQREFPKSWEYYSEPRLRRNMAVCGQEHDLLTLGVGVSPQLVALAYGAGRQGDL